MKKEIHPQYFADAKIQCACGNVMHIGSTKKDIEVEICGNCHPFYTGKEKLIDAAGRVDKFKKRASKAAPVSQKRNKRARK
ncbi:MAG: 50S ribosomal protein L31 [bacterium]|nr:50S ribosomal protein L31 [bacterium]